jgi:hypothetical protein
MNKNGSALIFVSFIMAFVGIIAILFTRSTILYYGYAVERIQHIRAQYALDALGKYGIARALTGKKKSPINLNVWPPLDGPYRALLQLHSDKNQIHIIGKLLFDNKKIGTVECDVDTLENGEKIVRNWTYR